MRRGVVVAMLLGACGGAERTPPASVTPGRSAPASPAPSCTTFEVARFLERHAKAYGAARDVDAMLPVVIAGVAEIEEKSGTTEIVLAKERHRFVSSVAGLAFGGGVDARGAWSLEGGTGVVERVADAEASSVRFDAWLLRRAYLSLDAARDRATCRATRVEIAYARPEVGDPVVVFDLASASVLSIVHKQPDGKRPTLTFESWSDAEDGVRWPKKMTMHPASGSAAGYTLGKPTKGLACRTTTPSLDAEACLAPPRDRFSLRWPPSGRVRVPMTFLDGQIVVRASLEGRDVWALLDSGAGITSLDATAPAARAWKPSLELEGSGSTQSVRFGIGTLPTIAIGELRADDVPAASVPIPALEAFGTKRPEIILGYAFFAAAAIRVDYKKREVVFGRDPTGLASPDARKVPVRHLPGMLLVEGAPALFQVDTGASGALDLVKRFTSARGLPGDRKSVTVRGRFGAGDAETTTTYFRLGRASVGPIRADGATTHVADPPGGGDVAGLAGNRLWSRCDAIVFDPASRDLLVEGACDRPIDEKKMGWYLSPKADPKAPERPWVVASVWPGSAAERAGIREGDRVVEVDGKPATLDVETMTSAESRATGTKVAVVVLRGGERKRVVVELAPLLP